LNIRLKNIYVG